MSTGVFANPSSVKSVNQLLEMADGVRTSDINEFRDLLNELESRQKEFSTNQAFLFKYLKAYKEIFSGDYSKSLESYNQILNDDKAGPEIKFRANYSIVNIAAITQDWASGFKHLSSSVDLASRITDPDMVEKGHLTAAMFYNLVGQNDLAFEQAQSVLLTAKDARNICLANQFIVESLYKLGKLPADAVEFEKAIEFCLVEGEGIIAAISQSFKVKLLIEEQQFNKALNIVTNSLDMVEQSKYAPLIEGYYALLAQSHFKLLNNEKALEFAKKAISYSSGRGNAEYRILANSILFELHQQQGDFEQALKYHQQYAQLNKAFQDDTQLKLLAYQQAQHQSIQQKQQIELLNNQNDLLKTQQELIQSEAENSKLLALMATVIMVLLAFFGVKSMRTQAKLRALAEFDPLTKVFNRRHYLEVSHDVLESCEKAKLPVCYAILDLDLFKNINDSFGHSIGDWALQKTAEEVNKNIRQADIFARLGGEEFVLVLPRCDMDNALSVIEKCRIAIEQINTEETGFDFSITASFGVTDSNRSGYQLETIFSDADKALYKSKEQGRNQITLAE